MRRSRNKTYDGTLFVAALGLLFLYIMDPYDKLTPPSIDEDPQGDMEFSELTDNIQAKSEKQPASEDVRNSDYRSRECRTKSYDIADAAVSIIITVPNLPSLNATLSSLQKYTTWKVVLEVIAVDHGDLAEKDMAKLENIVSDIPRGRFVYNPRQGHVSGRLLASKQAQGDALVFLEAGAIVTQGWLEPLLDTLNHNSKSLVMPSFDSVKNSEYIPNKEQFVPYIERDMSIRMKMTEEKSQEIKVATIRRECFAAKTWFFRHIGMLDADVGDYGGVHQEISLRVWQCGGEIHMATCSHIGILNPFNFLTVANPLNVWRISEMWIKSNQWDPFLTTNNRPKNVREEARKSVAEKMKAIRTKLQCDSPKLFIEKFLPKLSLFDVKPSKEDLAFQKTLKSMVAKAGGRAGLIRSKSAQQCLSPDEDRFLKLGPCDPAKAGVPRQKMTFRFTHLSQIRVDGRCVTVVKDQYLRVMDCDNANEKWNYREQQSFVWEDDGRLLFWFSKQCIMHVKDPDPNQNDRPVVMKRDCSRNPNVDFSTYEILY